MPFLLSEDDDEELSSGEQDSLAALEANAEAAAVAAAAAMPLPPGMRDGGWGQRPGPDEDVPGVLDLLTRALRLGECLPATGAAAAAAATTAATACCCCEGEEAAECARVSSAAARSRHRSCPLCNALLLGPQAAAAQ